MIHEPLMPGQVQGPSFAQGDKARFVKASVFLALAIAGTTVAYSLHGGNHKAYLTVFFFVATFGLLAMNGDNHTIVLFNAVLMYTCELVDYDDLMAGPNSSGSMSVVPLFIVGAAIKKSGTFDEILPLVMGSPQSWRPLTLFRTYFVTAFLSSILGNVTTVVFMIPLVMRWCEDHNVNPRSMMISLAFASRFGCAWTLLGGTINQLVSAELEDRGVENNLVSQTALWTPPIIIGLLYISLVTPWWFADKEASFPSQDQSGEQSTKSSEKSGFVDSRHAASMSGSLNLRSSNVFPSNTAHSLKSLGSKSYGRAPNEFTNSVKELSIRLASGRSADMRASSINVASGLGSVSEKPESDSNADSPNEKQRKLGFFMDAHAIFVEACRPYHKPLVVVLLAMLITLNIFGVQLITAAFWTAVGFQLIGVITVAESFAAIKWKIMLVIFGSQVLGRSFENNGIASATAQLLNSLNMPEFMVFCAIHLLCVMLGMFMSNSGALFIVLPIADELAQAAGLSITQTLLVIFSGCNSSFLTPMCSNVNLLVQPFGNYTWGDFFKFGLILMILNMFLCVLATYVDIFMLPDPPLDPP